MEDIMQIFLKVDADGEILESYIGRNIIAVEPFDYFFVIDSEIAKDIDSYKVILDGMKPSLVKK